MVGREEWERRRVGRMGKKRRRKREMEMRVRREKWEWRGRQARRRSPALENGPD
jgi:hypothetical protein